MQGVEKDLTIVNLTMEMAHSETNGKNDSSMQPQNFWIKPLLLLLSVPSQYKASQMILEG